MEEILPHFGRKMENYGRMEEKWKNYGRMALEKVFH